MIDKKIDKKIDNKDGDKLTPTEVSEEVGQLLDEEAMYLGRGCGNKCSVD